MENKHCLNCGSDLIGKFCPSCWRKRHACVELKLLITNMNRKFRNKHEQDARASRGQEITAITMIPF